MARLKKQELIDELISMGVEIDSSLNYNELYKIYKEKIDELENKPLNSVYTYKPEENEELIIDRPSEPVELIKEEIVYELHRAPHYDNNPIYIKNDKTIYEQYIKGNKDFEIKFKGKKIYSSLETSKDNIKPLDEYFTVYSKKYPYQGASIRYV